MEPYPLERVGDESLIASLSKNQQKGTEEMLLSIK